MTIDEAIKHCEEVAGEQQERADSAELIDILDGLDVESCKECAADHRQVATWLRELKELRLTVGMIKVEDLKSALTLLREYKAELNGWEEDPFSIIAEKCRTKSCKLCQWEEKCPYAGNYEYHPEDWRAENDCVL